MSDSNETIESTSLKRQLLLMQELTVYVIIDNKVVEDSPILKEKAKKMYESITDLKNHITN